jgi:hypothetical protein
VNRKTVLNPALLLTRDRGQQAEFQRYSKKTRHEQFLEEIDVVMPWSELLALVAARICADKIQDA